MILLASSFFFCDFNIERLEKFCQTEVDKISYELTHYDMKPTERQYYIGKMSAYNEVISYCEEIKEEE